MAKERRIWVEWINIQRAECLMKKRITKAQTHEREMGKTPRAYDFDAERESIWDWVEMDECLESRGFPNVAMAKGWAKQNYGLDAYEQPRVMQEEWEPDRAWDTETTVELTYEGGGIWTNVKTGELA